MTNEQEQFIKNIAAACAENKDYNILPSLTIAQAIKESNWGKSGLAKYYNFFGMKWNRTCGCDYVELPTKEWDGVKYITIYAKFRKYSSFSEGIKGYYNFIKSYKRYSNLIGEKDPEAACIKIHKDGWATSPDYGTSLYKDYILKYNLTQFDNNEAVEVPVPEDKKIHIVSKNESLWAISEKYYGNGSRWKEILAANNLNSHIIYVGQKLIIP